jgi:hypothetical protein
MSKFATAVRARVRTTGKGTTHEGGAGFTRDPQSELYVTAVSTLLEPTFYESASDRENRIVELARKVALSDPEWVLRFVTWLRAEANMRSVSVLVACEAVKARLDEKVSETPAPDSGPGLNRQLIAAACLRADEPGEVLAYWTNRYGRNLPMPVKRGLADAARKVYTERSALRYDGGSGAVRLGDVVDLVHPTPKGPEQSALFGWLLDRRHGRRETPEADLALLPGVTARTELNALPVRERHAFARRVLAGEPDAEATWIKALAGQWEWGKSWLGQESEDGMFERVSDADQWRLFVEGGLGYMAMIRNLRNFDNAKISPDLVKHISGVIADREEVAKSRQFPFRFYSAYKATAGSHWAAPLAAGLDWSLPNVPALDGNSLILLDMSGSMFGWGGDRTKTTLAELAALFGVAVALRAEKADVIAYGTGSRPIKIDKGKSVMDHLSQFGSMGGTQTTETLRTNFKKDVHDRVILITDEQLHPDRFGSTFDSILPPEVPLYSWNLGGNRIAQAESGPNRFTFAGLTDQSWRLIPLLEGALAEEEWPF